MGKCYCDYCDVFLTHDSVAVRKQHNDGNRHKQNVCDYYRQFVGQKTQRLIDDVVAAFEEKVLLGLVVPTYGQPSLNGAAPVMDDAPPPPAGVVQTAANAVVAGAGGLGGGELSVGTSSHPARLVQGNAPAIGGMGASLSAVAQSLPPS